MDTAAGRMLTSVCTLHLEAMDIERTYVREAYSHLASLSATIRRTTAQKTMRHWVNVQKFVNQLPSGSIGLDIGKCRFQISHSHYFLFSGLTNTQNFEFILLAHYLEV